MTIPEPKEGNGPWINKHAPELVVMELRSLFAEYLVGEAAAGLRDARWCTQAHAFIFWCWRQDNEPRTDKPCPDCHHAIHVGVCGQPSKGGYPYLEICLCGDKHKPDHHDADTTISRRDLRTIMDWGDGAVELLRRIKRVLVGHTKLKEEIARLLGTKK